MLPENLKQIEDRAVGHAKNGNHSIVALDHLLLALTDDKDAVAILEACSVNIELFRKELSADVKSLKHFVTNGAKVEPRSSASFNRALVWADFSAQNDIPTGAHILGAIFDADPVSRAVQFLGKHGIKSARDITAAKIRLAAQPKRRSAGMQNVAQEAALSEAAPAPAG